MAADSDDTSTMQDSDAASPLETNLSLSVVIPTYNRAEILTGTLDRILGLIGADPAIELILVNDGSSDRTEEILTRFQQTHSRVKAVTQENKGPGSARNVGAQMAQGDIILFLGDDTRPQDSRFFESHLRAHQRFPSPGKAVLGKIVWPDGPELIPNLVMSLIQGDGQQQFNFKYLRPWTFYDWSAFYTSNISIKRQTVDNWAEEGFSSNFFAAGFEDLEFAYRLAQKYEDFGVYYIPTAVVQHHHPYSVQGFMNRQVTCGLSMDVFLQMHPELEEDLVGAPLIAALTADSGNTDDLPLEHYVSIIEGLKSWALVIERHYGLGTKNWHSDLVNAIFHLCIKHGYLMGRAGAGVNYGAAYRLLLETFQSDMGRAIETEIFGQLTSASLL